MRLPDIHFRSRTAAVPDGPIAIMPVAGICNIETKNIPVVNRFSTASLHFSRLLEALKEDIGQDIMIQPPITLGGLGILKSIDKTYDQYEAEVNRRVEQLPPGTRPLFVGHSLGGTMVTRGIAANKDWNTAGIVTLGAPLQKREYSRSSPFRNRWQQIGNFAEDTAGLLQDTDNQVRKVLIGSIVDGVVPPYASVPRLHGNSLLRLMFTPTGNSHPGFEDVESRKGVVEHGMLPLHRAVIGETVRAVAEMIDETKPARTAAPQPKLADVHYLPANWHQGVTAELIDLSSELG